MVLFSNMNMNVMSMSIVYEHENMNVRLSIMRMNEQQRMEGVAVFCLFQWLIKYVLMVG